MTVRYLLKYAECKERELCAVKLGREMGHPRSCEWLLRKADSPKGNDSKKGKDNDKGKTTEQ